MNEKNTFIVAIEKTELADLFAPGGLEKILLQISENARSIAPDITTSKGRKEIASIASKVARSKTYLDGLGKEFVSDLKTRTKAVDGERKRMRDYLDALKEDVRRPLTEYERREAERQNTIRARIDALKQPPGEAIDKIKARIAELEAVAIDDSWHEFSEKARTAKEEALAQARVSLADAEEVERQAAERKAREERERRERETRIAAESAARAKREAEEKARKEREAERRRHERAIRDAELRAEKAARAERERIELEHRKAEEEKARRIADIAHRSSIRDGIIARLIACGLSDEQANAVLSAISSNKIPHVKITY